MASVRITNDMRTQAIKAILAHRFDQQEKDLCEEARLIGLSVFAQLMGDDLGKLDDLPKKWFHRTYELDYTVQGHRSPFIIVYNHDTQERDRITLGGGQRGAYSFPILLPAPASLPYDLHKYGVNRGIPSQCANALRIVAASNRARALLEMRDETREKLQGLLAGFTTLKRLEAEWPEVVRFFQVQTAAPAPVPAIPFDTLNKFLRIG